MKHPSTRELFDYWNNRRGARAAPERSEIEPSAIRRVLADTFIFRFDPGAGHPFRIAGTRVCALFGRELNGIPFTDIWAAEWRSTLCDIVTTVASETIGVVGGASAASSDGTARELEFLVLPLTQRGSAAPRILGTESLGPLTLGVTRYLGPETGPCSLPHRRPLTPGHARFRHGLIVYDGGHA